MYHKFPETNFTKQFYFKVKKLIYSWLKTNNKLSTHDSTYISKMYFFGKNEIEIMILRYLIKIWFELGKVVEAKSLLKLKLKILPDFRIGLAVFIATYIANYLV